MAALLAHIAIPPKLLASLIVLGLVLVVWAIVAIAKAGSKPAPPQVAPNAPPCNTCGGPARWNYNGWVCDRCQRQVVPMGAPQMPYGQPPQAPYGQPPMQSPYGQPPAQMAPQGPPCPTCQSPARWIPESNGWGCDRCRQMIGAPPQA